MRKTVIIMFFLGVSTLFSSFAVISDQTLFQIELTIQHSFHQDISITEYSENTPISDAQDGSKSVTVTPLNSTDSFEVCNIEYTSNVYGRNLIYLKAFPLYLLDNQGNPTNESVGYTLGFENQDAGWDYSLEVNSSAPVDMTIPITVPFELVNDEVQTLFATISITGVIPDYDNMSAGTYRATIQMGLEAL